MNNFFNLAINIAVASAMNAQPWAVWFAVFPDGDIKLYGAPFGGDVPGSWVRFTHEVFIPQKG